MCLLCAGVAQSALWQVVEAHQRVNALEDQLQVLMEVLDNKEALLEQARELVSVLFPLQEYFTLCHIM